MFLVKCQTNAIHCSELMILYQHICDLPQMLIIFPYCVKRRLIGQHDVFLINVSAVANKLYISIIVRRQGCIITLLIESRPSKEVILYFNGFVNKNKWYLSHLLILLFFGGGI